MAEFSLSMIPSSWFGITNRLDAKSMIALSSAVDDKGVDRNDVAAVRMVWDELVTEARDRYATLKSEASMARQAATARAQEMDKLKTFLGV